MTMMSDFIEKIMSESQRDNDRVELEIRYAMRHVQMRRKQGAGRIALARALVACAMVMAEQMEAEVIAGGIN